MGVAKRFVPNLVKANGEQIGEVFGQNTIDKIVSRRLDASFDVIKFARGASRVLKPGGTIEMELYSNNPAFSASFKAALQNAGFKNISSDLVTTHPAYAVRVLAASAAGCARASRKAVRALRPLRRPVSTIEQRAA